MRAVAHAFMAGVVGGIVGAAVWYFVLMPLVIKMLSL